MEKQEVKFSKEQQLLLKWFQIILIGVCGVVFIFILITNSSSLQKLDSYILLILIILFLLGISHYLFRKKNFSISSALLVLTGVIGPWGSVVIDYSISQGNLFPLVYLTLPIIFSGFFTSISVNIIVGLIQVIGLLIFIFSNQIGFSGGVSSLFFYVVFILAISLIINLLNRSNKRIIDQQVERMRAEIEESAKRKERIQDLYNNAPCGYHSLDENGFFVDINDTELQWLGYERGEVIGKIKLTDIATPSSIAIFKDIFPKFNKGRISKRFTLGVNH